jgi:hypothetical protein
VSPLAGRGGWRFTVHRRIYAAGALPRDTIIGELTDARSRRLTQVWNKPAQLTFTVDGHSGSATAVQEFATDVIAWRWDDYQQRDVAMFRGVVAQAQDTLSEQTAVVTFTCHDYLAMMGRRFYTPAAPTIYTATEQDTIASDLIARAGWIFNGNGATGFNPGAFVPLAMQALDPSGNNRGASGQLRDRTYQGGDTLLDALDKLATVANGFDYDVVPGGDSQSLDTVRIFYPYQGVQKSRPQLQYGTTVAALTRTVNSADYANYQRVIGNNGTATANAPQLYGEAWNTDANNVTVAPQGLWMAGDNASDVSVQSTLNDHAAGQLARSGLVVPSYSVTLRPGWFVTNSFGNPQAVNMGDVVPLIIQEGRLNVNTTVRVLGIDFAIGDDGQEDVTLTLGRPDVTITDILTANAHDIDALARR